jgi:hypothetical protein
MQTFRAGSGRFASYGSQAKAWLAGTLVFVLVGAAWSAGCGPPAGTAPGAGDRVAHDSPAVSESAEVGSAAARGAHPETVPERASRYDLGPDERRGGHTLARHVAKSDDDLRRRLEREAISAASTYSDRDTAERVVFETLRRSQGRIEAWTARRGGRPNLALRYRGSRDRPIGRMLARGARTSVPSTDAVVVLRWDMRRDDFYVLTSYPEGRR